MGARAPLGLAAWGAGRPVGPDVRGLAYLMGSFSRGLDFWEAMDDSLLLAENYN